MSNSFSGNKVRIKIKGLDIHSIEVAMRQIFNVVEQHNKDAKNANKELFKSGIVRTPRRHHVYSVLRAPNRHKDSQQHLESYEHK
jgi:ribosomal protein S10